MRKPTFFETLSAAGLGASVPYAGGVIIKQVGNTGSTPLIVAGAGIAAGHVLAQYADGAGHGLIGASAFMGTLALLGK